MVCRGISRAAYISLSAFLLCATALPLAAPAQAQSNAPVKFDIAPQPLSTALKAFAQATGVQFVYSTPLAQDVSSPGVQGNYPISESLQHLLAGTGLSFHFTNDTTITIEKLGVNARGAKLLSPVQVEGTQTAGANGSTDPTATEGTGSYTTSAMTIGSKAPLSIRETPQDVTVVTQQQMQDENLTNLSSALNQAPGISMVTGTLGPLAPTFYSRGLQVTNFQFDGGTPVNYQGGTGFDNVLMPDMAEFDHIEILQGADGMFAGAGTASGTINLVRKRPLDHDQLLLEANAGSWNNYRAMMDVTGPLDIADLGDKIRGRLVMTYQTQDYFYQTASANHVMLYGIVEADVTSSTLLTLGGSFLQENTVPWFLGLPRYQSGPSLNLPRSTSFAFPWSYWKFSNPELFARVDQRINENWTARFDFTDLGQSSREKIGKVSGAINPDTLAGATTSGLEQIYSSHQYLFDATLNGKFQLFGREHQIVIGGSYQDVNANNSDIQSSVTFSQPVNVFSFNPSAYPDPAVNLPNFEYPVFGQKQYGAYATARFQILDELHLMAGARYSGYSYDQLGEDLNPYFALNPTRYSNAGVVTPYGAVLYDLTDQWSAYVSYTSIYQSQSQELQGPPPGTPLTPEDGNQYEAGVKGELLDGALNASASIYRINEQNVAVSDTSYPTSVSAVEARCCYLAAGNVESEGVDLEANGQIFPGWQVSSGLTYNFNRTIYNGTASDDGQTYTTITPKWLFKLWTTYQLPDDWNQWSVGFGVNAQSSTFVSGTIPTGYTATGTEIKPLIPFNFEQGGYGIFSGRIAYKADDHWNVAINVNNILDKTYYQTVGTPIDDNWYGDPRNFMLTIRYAN